MPTFTADELIAMVSDLGLPAELEADENEFQTISCEFDGMVWKMLLGDDGPFFSSIILTTHRFVSVDPFRYANEWNMVHIPPAVVLEDEPNDIPITDEDGNRLVTLFWRIYFSDSTTRELISDYVLLFHDDVCEFLYQEVGERPEAKDCDNSPIDRHLQIQLELTLNSPQSARSLARSLGVTKYEINQVLYHLPDLFEKQGTSPPFWSNRAETV